MISLLEKARRKRTKCGFTLVELLVVIVVLAVLAAIVLPKFMNSSKRSKEAALKSDLKVVRNAIGMFHADTGAYPKTLNALMATEAPAKGLDSDGNEVDILPGDWHGPYLQDLPIDPISGTAFIYVITHPDVGKVKSSATGNSLDGSPYSTW
ncbi:MAG: prepilin-type N-terminal cleavage/methylation domain-containing protein [Armatimonadota bacterium]